MHFFGLNTESQIDRVLADLVASEQGSESEHDGMSMMESMGDGMETWDISFASASPEM